MISFKSCSPKGPLSSSFARCSLSSNSRLHLPLARSLSPSNIMAITATATAAGPPVKVSEPTDHHVPMQTTIVEADRVPLRTSRGPVPDELDRSQGRTFRRRRLVPRRSADRGLIARNVAESILNGARPVSSFREAGTGAKGCRGTEESPFSLRHALFLVFYPGSCLADAWSCALCRGLLA